MYLLIIFSIHFIFAQNSADFSGGAVRFGESSSTCDSSTVGSISYDSIGKEMKFCDSFTWQTISAAECVSTQPTDWTFTNLMNQNTSSTITSSIHQVSGISGCTMAIKVSGDGSPEYQICNDATCSSVAQTWSSTEGDITDGKYVQLRLTTGATANTSHYAYLIIGLSREPWAVTTTGNCTDPNPGVGTICSDGSLFLGFSPVDGAKTYITPCVLGKSLSGGSCTGTATQYHWANGATINTSLTTSTLGETNSSNLAGLSNADSPYDAAVACDGLSQHSQTDWYLPAPDEARMLSANCALIPGYGCNSTTRHWTSQEASAANAYFWIENSINFVSGSKTSGAGYTVFCMRRD